MLILSLTILSLAVSADVANPMRIYSDSNLFRTYISGEFTPSYATTGAYGTTKGKHIEQIYVKAHGKRMAQFSNGESDFKKLKCIF